MISIDGITKIEEDIQAEIISMDGRRLSIINGTLTTVNISLRAQVQLLSSGLYHLRVSTTDKIQTLKLIKH